MDNSRAIEYLLNENSKLKEENERLKNKFFIPKIVNNIFDYFILLNVNLSNIIEQFDEKK